MRFRHPGTAAGLSVACMVLAAVPAGAVPPCPGIAAEARPRLDLGPAIAGGLDLPAARPARLPHHLLILLVDFSDRPHALDVTPARVDSLYFGSTGSVREYYARSSYGRLQIDGQVSPWLRLPRSLADYADAVHDGAGVRGAYPHNARRMVEDAIRAADPVIDFARFDDDGPDGLPASGDDDGVVDALVVLHAGAGAEYGDPTTILSHTWSTAATVSTADGVVAWKYSTVSEASPLGVRAHEFGHLLGLPDLYDRRSTTRLGGGLGDWSLMASGAWLDDGNTPADLDATSKIQLGFVDPIVPAANAAGLPLHAPHDGGPGDVYRVWTHGRFDFESLVIENRQPQGQDAFLPGGGLLVYHVDEHQAHNDDPDRPRIQLLQADGHEDIERRFNNGDATDPYPGLRLRLGPDTQPGTRARDGADSQLRIDAISAPTGLMHFDLGVETTPSLVVLRQTVREIAGDGDGEPEAGERVGVRLVLQNIGLATGPLQVQAAARPQAAATWTVDAETLSGIAKDDTAGVEFDLAPRADLGDPAGLALHLACTALGWSDSLDTILGLGAQAGFQACLGAEPTRFTSDCSDPAQPWIVSTFHGAGAWNRVTRAGEFGSVYRSAAGPRYGNDVDVALVSPTFLLHSSSELRLLHAYATQDDAAGWAFDGGRVEISLDGHAWEALTPRGGYPRRLQPESVPALAAAGVFAGSSPRRWDVFELGTRRGSARLRFRFVSGDSIGGPGWEIARVEVASTPPVLPAAARVELAAEPNPFRFSGRIAFRITASLTSAARATTLAIYDPRGRLVREIPHAAVPAESGYFTWDGTDATGRRVASGIYFARLDWGGVRAATKVLVLR